MHLKKLPSLIIASLFLLNGAAASATPWHVMGPRALGMGGAGVAVAQGPLASYWNPAGLGQLYNSSGLIFPVGIRAAFTGSVLEGANDFHQLKSDCDQGLSSCTPARITEALNKLNQNGSGALIDIGGAAAFKLKRAVVFVHSLTYAGVTPEAELNVAGVATNPGNIGLNESKLTMRGANFIGVGLGYGREILESGFILGANLKGVFGRIGYDEIILTGEDPGADSFADFRDNLKTSFQPSVDAGFLWDMRETFPSLPFRPRIGVVGRDLNNPKFKQPAVAKAAGERGNFRLNGQVRGGIALSPFKFWHLAADLDITDNITPIDGFKSRFLAVGTEINVFNSPRFNIPLRAGLQKNISKDADSSLAFTGGLGLNFLHIMLDLGIQISSRRTQIQSEGKIDKIPNNVAASARFAFLFGADDEGGRNQ